MAAFTLKKGQVFEGRIRAVRVTVAADKTETRAPFDFTGYGLTLRKWNAVTGRSGGTYGEVETETTFTVSADGLYVDFVFHASDAGLMTRDGTYRVTATKLADPRYAYPGIAEFEFTFS